MVKAISSLLSSMTELGNAKYYAISSTATQYMLMTLSMYRNINVEVTKIVDITQSRVNDYNRKLLGPATSAACIIPNNVLGFSNYLFLSHGQQLQGTLL